MGNVGSMAPAVEHSDFQNPSEFTPAIPNAEDFSADSSGGEVVAPLRRRSQNMYRGEVDPNVATFAPEMGIGMFSALEGLLGGQMLQRMTGATRGADEDVEPVPHEIESIFTTETGQPDHDLMQSLQALQLEHYNASARARSEHNDTLHFDVAVMGNFVPIELKGDDTVAALRAAIAEKSGAFARSVTNLCYTPHRIYIMLRRIKVR